MPGSQKYKNPPLTEAVFEIFFTTKNWSPIIPGIFYNEVKNDFPNIHQAPGGFGMAFDASGFRIGPGGNNLTQYRSNDNSTIIQLSNVLFTVNKVPKYEGWESYRKIIVDSLKALRKVLDIEINRIGLKAINKIDVKSHSYENFKNSFNVFPNIPEGMSKNVNSIQLNIETPVVPETEILALSLLNLRKEPNYEAPTMFQIYYTRIKDNSDVKIESWLETAHAALREAFEATVSEQKKKEFNV